MNTLVARYLDGHHMDPLVFVETAYYRKYGKRIPSGALIEDQARIVSGLDPGPLPEYLIEFLFVVRGVWWVVHRKGCPQK